MPFVPKVASVGFQAKEEQKNFGQKAADFLGFTAFGKGLATLGADTRALDEARKRAEKVQAEALARRKANALAGKDTTRLDSALKRSNTAARQLNAQQLNIGTGGGLSNREVIGSAINVASSLPAGFGGITAAKTSFRPVLGQVSQTLVDQGLKGGFKKATGLLAAEGAVAGGLSGLGFGLMDKEKDAMGVAGSALGGAAAGAVLAPAIGAAAIPVARAVSRATNPVIRATERQVKLDKLVGAISQGKTEREINAAKSAYGAIDTEGIETFSDLYKTLDEQIAETSNGLDQVLSTNTTRRPFEELTTTIKVGDQTVSYNYVDDAFGQLEDFYVKTNDVPGQTRLAQKRALAEAEGLTIKDVNDLAKEHGAKLNAFNANGQAASGLSKQAAENTRKGLKATARQQFNDPLYNAADAEIANLIKARDAAESMMVEVQKLQNKIKDRSLGERAGRLGFQLLDLFTLRGLSGFTQAMLGRGTGLKTFNALDLERQLQKNLKEVQKILNKDAPAASVVDDLERYIQRESQSALPANQPKTTSAASTAKNVPIQAGIPRNSLDVNKTGVEKKTNPGTKLYGSAFGITPETDENGNVTGFGYNPVLGAGGIVGGAALSKALTKPGVAPKAFEGFSDLSTKLLEKLKGRSTVSKQFISDLTNSPDLKQAEKDLVRKALEDAGDEINVPDFANRVKSELLPLTIKEPKNISEYRGQSGRYESINLPDELRGPVANYKERVYESPIKTSAGGVHFAGARGSTPENYFAHSRIEDLPDNASRRVIEIQSDLFQKGRLEDEGAKGFSGMYQVTGASPDTQSGIVRNFVTPDMEAKRAAEIAKLEPYRNTWHERVIREEVKQAAKDGKTKLQFPTGETAMKIEGLSGNPNAGILLDAASPIREIDVGALITRRQDNSSWVVAFKNGNQVGAINWDSLVRENPMLTIEEVSKNPRKYATQGAVETFPVDGDKVDPENPIYKFYEKTVAKYLTNKYGGKVVTDPQGVKWVEIDVKPEYKGLPVEAFGALGAIGLGTAMNRPLGTNEKKK